MPNDAPAESGGDRIVVLSGPSGSGKSTIVNRLVERELVRLMKAISATTRPPRAGETDGVDYFFLSPEVFEARRAKGDFLECAAVHGSGYWYGTLKSELDRARRAGAWSLLEIDVEGALKVMEAYPNAVTIFLLAPSEAEYERRLRKRGTEREELIQRRLATARRELEFANRYCYRVVNRDLDQAVAEISDILLSQEARLNA